MNRREFMKSALATAAIPSTGLLATKASAEKSQDDITKTPEAEDDWATADKIVHKIERLEAMGSSYRSIVFHLTEQDWASCLRGKHIRYNYKHPKHVFFNRAAFYLAGAIIVKSDWVASVYSVNGFNWRLAFPEKYTTPQIEAIERKVEKERK